VKLHPRLLPPRSPSSSDQPSLDISSSSSTCFTYVHINKQVQGILEPIESRHQSRNVPQQSLQASCDDGRSCKIQRNHRK
jgi:hypothetical protein